MTVRELSDLAGIKILVDHSSKGQMAVLSQQPCVQTFVHDSNYGHDRNQQTCNCGALAAGADAGQTLRRVGVQTPCECSHHVGEGATACF